MIISWLDSLIRMWGKGGMRDVWFSWSLPDKRWKQVTCRTVQKYCKEQMALEWKAKEVSSIIRLIGFRMTDHEAPRLSHRLLCRSQERRYPQSTGLLPTEVGEKKKKILSTNNCTLRWYVIILVCTCRRNTWQYRPEKLGPTVEQHCCINPGWLTFPASTLLPIFPNASYTVSNKYKHWFNLSPDGRTLSSHFRKLGLFYRRYHCCYTPW